MMQQDNVCPKCRGTMIQGSYTGQDIGWEQEGEHSFIKNEGRKIKTYACTKCGYIESYVVKSL